VKTILLIAADNIRALLRQRLLLGLMLLALAMIAIFSAFLVSQRRLVTITSVDASVAEDSGPSDPASSPGRSPIQNRTKPKTRGDVSHLTEKQRKQMNETMDQMSSTFQAGFYQVASFGGSLVSLFIFSTAVSSEIRRGTIKITLTKPVSRTQFILGKYLGGIAVMAAYAALASTAIILFAKFGHLSVSPAMKFAPWLMFCRQLMLGSLAMLLSLFVHPFVGAVLAFFSGNGFYGRTNPLFYLMPSYGVFNLFGAMLQGTLISGHDVLLLTLYALDFIVLMLALALWRFRTQELI